MKKLNRHQEQGNGAAGSVLQMQKDMERGSPQKEERLRIKKWLKEVRFKKTILGGVNEADVWKKIAELNELYEAELAAERIRYDVLLKEYADNEVKRLEKVMNEKSKIITEMGKAGDETEH
ncbi:hypothetical protein [Eisenbergiella sp.]